MELQVRLTGARTDTSRAPARINALYTLSLRTPDVRLRGQFTIAGEQPASVLANGRPTYWTYGEGHAWIEINPDRACTWLSEAQP